MTLLRLAMAVVALFVILAVVRYAVTAYRRHKDGEPK